MINSLAACERVELFITHFEVFVEPPDLSVSGAFDFGACAFKLHTLFQRIDTLLGIEMVRGKEHSSDREQICLCVRQIFLLISS